MVKTKTMGAFFAALTAALIACGVDNELNKGEWASWVQAFGSIAAVGGAALGIWWQVREQRRQQARPPLEMSLAALSEALNLLEFARPLATDLYIHAEDDLAYRIRLSFEDPDDDRHHIATLLRKFSVSRLPEAADKVAFRAAQACFENVLELERRAKEMIDAGGLHSPEIKAQHDRLAELLVSLDRRLKFLRGRVAEVTTQLSQV